MSSEKKKVRERFRQSVFERDHHRCRVCNAKDVVLDAHHITDRNLMPNGGYVAENGIALCPTCHEKAEIFHSTGTAHPGFAPEDLYRLIRSDVERARKASEKLKSD
jgi:5-methylcytosine-specific restriction endonuclease McrA